ncbi:MAG: hypothetical protein IKX18_01995 [Muribaculaceae bacterium]|nr:hypothetical protein [Muribaculaceae bacterium]
MMKRIRLLISLLVMLVAASGYAQDSYREVLKDYLKISQKEASEKMLTQFHQLNPMFFEYKQGVDFDQLATRFIDEQFGEIMADMTQDLFKKNNITESDMRQMMALMNTPEGETYREHTTTWSKQFEEVLKEEMEQPLMSAMEGTPISSSVVANSDIPESYAKKFMQYFEDNRSMDQFIGAFNQPLKMIGVEMPESFMEWMQNNVGTLAMNSAYGILTEADLDYSAALSNYDFYHHIVDATVNMTTENLMTRGLTMISKYVDWMKAQGISVSSMGEQALESIQQSFTTEE